MAPTTLNEAPVLTHTGTPDLDDLHYWWEKRQSDPDTVIAYGDDAPQNFTELLARIDAGEYLLYLAYHLDRVVGAMWLHDIAREHDGTPYAGWLGTYVLPEHRGKHTTKSMWDYTREAVTALGVRHVYISSHHANTRAHTVAERHLGFHPVGICPAFMRCQGEPADFLILSMHEEDIAEAWALAHARASKQLISQGSCLLQSKVWLYGRVGEGNGLRQADRLAGVPSIPPGVGASSLPVGNHYL